MKREIKFRAWDSSSKNMLTITPYQWNVDSQSNVDYFNNEFDITETQSNRIEGKSVFLTFDGDIVGVLPINESTTQSQKYEYPLMQYTCKIDEKGIDIYESDIVTIDGINDKLIVVFQDYSFAFKNRSTGVILPFSISNHFRINVVGNIYKNDDLLPPPLNEPFENVIIREYKLKNEKKS